MAQGQTVSQWWIGNLDRQGTTRESIFIGSRTLRRSRLPRQAQMATLILGHGAEMLGQTNGSTRQLSFGSLRLKISEWIRHPTLFLHTAANRILSPMYRYIGHEHFIGVSGNRSNSDGLYVTAVEEAVHSHKKFRTFKRDPRYRAILEHVSREQGAAYVEIIRKKSPEFLDKLDSFTINDVIGSPVKEYYPEFGQKISPTTLRYIKVASDFAQHFRSLDGARIAEIGVGYGGQFLVLDRIWKMAGYTMFDLPPVLSLASKYLESFLLNSSYELKTLNQCDGSQRYSLVISNYAFSELPAPLQRMYIEIVLRKAEHGYLSMNTGMDSVSGANHLTVEEMRALLPKFEIHKEEPETYTGNYIIVW